MLDKVDYNAALLRDLQKWRAELTDIDNGIANVMKRRDEIYRKVVAAEILLGQTATADSDSVKGAVASLMEDGRRRKPKDIRHDLVARGMDPSRIPTNSGNLYNALVRLVDEGVLERGSDGYYVNPKKSEAELEDLLK